jgi:hypothetical protein
MIYEIIMGAGVATEVVQCLFSKREALSANPSTTTSKKNTNNTW